MNFYDAKDLTESLIEDMDLDGESYPYLDLNDIKIELSVENYGNALDLLMASMIDLEEDLGTINVIAEEI